MDLYFGSRTTRAAVSITEMSYKDPALLLRKASAGSEALLTQRAVELDCC